MCNIELNSSKKKLCNGPMMNMQMKAQMMNNFMQNDEGSNDEYANERSNDEYANEDSNDEYANERSNDEWSNDEYANERSNDEYANEGSNDEYANERSNDEHVNEGSNMMSTVQVIRDKSVNHCKICCTYSEACVSDITVKVVHQMPKMKIQISEYLHQNQFQKRFLFDEWHNIWFTPVKSSSE